MASIALTGIWLALVSDLEAQLHFTKVRLTADYNRAGSIEEYTEGRLRIETEDTRSRSIQVSIMEVEREDRETLESWAGEQMVYRDSRGRMVFGTIFHLGEPENVGSEGQCDLSFTFQESTYSMEV